VKALIETFPFFSLKDEKQLNKLVDLIKSKDAEGIVSFVNTVQRKKNLSLWS
jgi:hypothetical protein